MSNPFETPLTDEEMIELDDFMLAAGEHGDCLAIDEAHGYLSALAVMPLDIGQATWLKAILGSTTFKDDGVRQHIASLLQRMYDDIVTTLEASLPLEPLIIEHEEDGEVLESYEGWCYGFMMAVGEYPDQWEKLGKDEAPLLLPIAQLAMLCNEDESEPGIDEEEYQMLLELLPGSVAGLYAFYRE